jgi:hypothetical protein
LSFAQIKNNIVGAYFMQLQKVGLELRGIAGIEFGNFGAHDNDLAMRVHGKIHSNTLLKNNKLSFDFGGK